MLIYLITWINTSPIFIKKYNSFALYNSQCVYSEKLLIPKPL
jgi:hypothetical protein